MVHDSALWNQILYGGYQLRPPSWTGGCVAIWRSAFEEHLPQHRRDFLRGAWIVFRLYPRGPQVGPFKQPGQLVTGGAVILLGAQGIEESGTNICHGRSRISERV